MSHRHPFHFSFNGVLSALVLSGALGSAQAAVVISQVYGGGASGGATYKYDYVELRNTGDAAVDLTGYSLQYASATGTNWGRVNLTGTLKAGGFYLVQLGGTTAGAAELPTPDQISSSISMSATAGKIALVQSTTTLPVGTCPTGTVLDFVGYGTTANCSEGSAPAPALSATLAAFRAAEGCTDTNVNGANFTAALPAPRNAGVVPTPCGGNPPPPPPPPPPAALTTTYTVQGSGAQSALVNQAVVVPGVITRVNNNGFYLQDPVGDGNPATSDGLFVFTGATSYPAVAVGNAVKVSGTVLEFSTGGSTVTELGNVTAVTLTGSGQAIAPTPISFPEATEGDLERYEGMLVQITGPFTISQNSFQAKYGQFTLAHGGRLEVPTNRYPAGSPEALALADANARRRLILDDGSSVSNPSNTPYLGAHALPRTGDQLVGSLIGVIDYGPRADGANPGDYRLHPTVAPTFAVGNARTSAPDAVGGNIKVASFNVLNYFTTFTNGQTASGQAGQGCSVGGSVTASNCRGADNATEFGRQRAKIIDALARINADAVGLMEIQNNGNVAAQNLVDGLNAVLGAGTYAVAPLPAQGTGTDAIRTAVIYKPARMVALASVSDTAAINDRPTLLQPFQLLNGERFSLAVNHFKSKGSCNASDPDLGQGCWNVKRTAQAQQLRNFLQAQAAFSGGNQLLVGDFNAYAKEDPINLLTGNGYADQVERFHPGAYSYVFDGQSGRLDHLLASPSLQVNVVGAAHWHINADEQPNADYNLEDKAPLQTCNGAALCPPDLYSAGPYRSSDHDPVIAGLNLYKVITAATADATLVGTAGDDKLFSGAGRRSITTGAGYDQIVFTATFTGGATVTDFAPGYDTISLKATLQALGVNSANPIGQGFVTCKVSGSDALISIDADGTGTAAVPRAMLLIKGQGCAVLNTTHFVF